MAVKIDAPPLGGSLKLNVLKDKRDVHETRYQTSEKGRPVSTSHTLLAKLRETREETGVISSPSLSITPGKHHERVWVNNTGYNLAVIARVGTVSKIPTTRLGILKAGVNAFFGKMVAIDQYRISIEGAVSELDIDMSRLEQTAYLDRYYDALRTAVDRARAQGHLTVEFSLYTSFDKSELVTTVQDNGVPRDKIHSLYSNSLDVVISIDRDSGKYPTHPFSRPSRISEHMDTVNRSMQSLHVAIDIVDNDDRVAPRYCKIFGRTIRIVPRRDESRGNGVRITYHWPELDIISRTVVQDEVGIVQYSESEVFYTIEEADGVLGLYKTQEEAESGGDLVSMNRQQLASRSAELESLRLERDRQKHEYETELFQLKHKFEKDKITLESTKLDQDRELSILKNGELELKLQLEREQRLVKELNQRLSIAENDHALKMSHLKEEYEQLKRRQEYEHERNSQKHEETQIEWKTTAVVATAAAGLATVAYKLYRDTSTAKLLFSLLKV